MRGESRYWPPPRQVVRARHISLARRKSFAADDKVARRGGRSLLPYSARLF